MIPAWLTVAELAMHAASKPDADLDACERACGFLVHETFDEREQAIRADERAKVEREVVAYLYEQATHWRDDDGESALMHAREVIAAGEHRPKPGQPKEGGK